MPAERGPSRAARAACLLFVVFLGLNMFSGQWSRLGVPLPMDRLVLVASMGCFLLCAESRERLGDVFAGQTTRVVLFGLFGAWATGSAVVVGSISDRDAAFALADRVLVPLFLFFFAPLVVATDRERDLLLKGLVVFGGYLGLTSVMSVLGPHALVFPRYINDASVGLGAGRARGPSVEAVGTGVDLVVFGFAATLLAFRSGRRSRTVGTVVAMVCFLGAFMTFTRSVWLAIAVSVVVVGAKFPALRRAVGVSVAVLAGVFALFLAAVPSVLHAATGRAGTTRSIIDRAYTYDAALHMVRTHPFFGVGWGRFLDNVPDYVWQSDSGPMTNVMIEAHNIFLARAAELGVPGLLLVVGCVLVGPAAVLATGRPRGQVETEIQVIAVVAVCAWFAAAMLSPMSYPLPNAMAWGLSGLALSWARRGRDARAGLALVGAGRAG